MRSQLAAALDRLKARFEPGGALRKERLLRRLAQAPVNDAATLIRLHEALLFLLAYPQSARVAQLAARELRRIEQRVASLRSRGADLSAFEEPEVSGIAGTGLSALFSYPVARRLCRAYPARVSIDWEGCQKPARLGLTLPRLIPLLEDDVLVEAHPPYLAWLGAASGRRTLRWLILGLEGLAMGEAEKAALYDSLELYLRWDLSGSPASRTSARLQTRRVFYHRRPLIHRADVSLENEFAGPRIPVRKVSVREAEKLIGLACETSAARYRELHGFTYGDPRQVLEAELGRGVRVFVCGVPPAHRLPVRAYHAGMFFKNGVPAGYVEGLSLAERMEIGFNLYYTFREGETAWIYARLLALFHQLLGVKCFVVDPYQIGQDNEEAIESGAFWFYRKLGFRPVLPDVLRLAEAEQQKAAARPGYRTPARTLRKLAASRMVWEAPGAERGAWDWFEARNLGMAVARRIRVRYGGSVEAARQAAWRRLAKAVGTPDAGDLALVLDLIPDLESWSAWEKRLCGEWLRAKQAAGETAYLHALARHGRLRRALIKFGSLAASLPEDGGQ